jgi:hypothetical protein
MRDLVVPIYKIDLLNLPLHYSNGYDDWNNDLFE